MAISWTSFALEKSPSVWIGTSEAKVKLVKAAKVETKTYYKDDKYTLYNYHAVVTGLEPNTEYFYKVGSATEKKFQSSVSSFKTARESGDESPFTVAVKKDQLGNYTAFNACFRMPSPESGGVLNMWYSFEYASVHFTTISSETDFKNAPSNAYTKRTYGNFGNQLAWLEADLKAAHANRATVPWIVVGMHRPLYTLRSCDANGVPNDDYESLKVQKAFEKLFIKYKVDLVYQGHVHAYERHYPTANSKAIMTGVSKDGKTYTNPKAPVHVIVGIAGNSEGLYKFKNPPSPKWLALMDNEHYGITTLSVTPTNLTVTMLEAATGTVYDEFSIIKEASASQTQI
eukprot:jgi/Phyca11/533399/estExt2_fgenesh1_pg.C_PHYCAscaffold_130105